MVLRRLNIVVFIALLTASPALANWPDNPSINVPISTFPGEKLDVYLTTDNQNGALLVWEDSRAGNWDIYMQRLDENGTPKWSNDGVPVSTAANHQNLYHSSDGTAGITPIISDGSGGAFVVWQDSRFLSTRARDIYCQRMSADGLPLWTINGVPVAFGSGNEEQPSMCSDGNGGVIIVWQDKNHDPIFYDVYAQRLNADGAALWNNGNPLPINTMDWDQNNVTISPDGHGGAFVVFTDSQLDVNDIHAQHVNANGDLLWPQQGVVVVAANGNQKSPVIVESEDGNPIIAWRDLRAGNYDIYAQKLDADTGTPLWATNGRAICTAPESQYRPSACTDGEGGLILSWFDYRSASGPPWDLNIYAQKVLSDGSIAWQYNGAPVCLAPDAQRDNWLISDGQGGAIIAWEDNRQGTGREDIYAQHLNADSEPQLALDGQAISTVTGNQNRPNLVLGAEGAIIAWTDDRHTLYAPDIYAARVVISNTSAAPLPGASAFGLKAWPNPFNPQTTIRFELPAETTVEISIHDLAGHRLATLLPSTVLPAGPHALSWQPQAVAAGMYLLQLKTPTAVQTQKLTLVP